MKNKMSDEAVENLIEFINTLRKIEKVQAKMSEQEKNDNSVKMGDIYY